MDAFFASVEQLDEPSLRGRPVAVGGDPRGRGVVAAASYEARAWGVRSAMPMSRAVRLCPELVRVPVRMSRYVELSVQIRELLRREATLVEMASLDEAYLDVSAAGGDVTDIARRVKAQIRVRTGLTASAGAGPCKLVAKIASDLGKPDGLVVVEPSRTREFLAPLPVARLWGVGKVTEKKLAALGVRTIGELAAAAPDRLARRLGPSSAVLIRLARGEDDRPVEPSRPTRSISCERTLAQDTKDLREVVRLIDRFAEDLQVSLREEGLRARTVVLKLRYSDFTAVTRSRTMPAATDDGARVADEARRLVARTLVGRRPVRLVGVTLTGLVDAAEPCQQSLFPPTGASE